MIFCIHGKNLKPWAERVNTELMIVFIYKMREKKENIIAKKKNKKEPQLHV